MITLTNRDVIIDAESMRQLSQEFRARHCVMLQGLLEVSLLELLRPRLEAASWKTIRHDDGIGAEVELDDDYATSLLHFAVNAPAFLEAIRALTGCAGINRFRGRVFRMDPAADHYDSWHDDMSEGRLVGMSINLSFGGYEGGELELKDMETQAQLARIATVHAGNATLFRIASRLQHRVAPLRGHRPRTAFAGWFKSGMPDPVNRAAERAFAAPPTGP